jgi:hypothetical protein
MIRRGARWMAAVVLALGAAPALAQPAPADPIDALLRQKAVEEEPDVAATGSSAVDPDPLPPAQPQAYVPARPILTEPVFLHEVGKAPDGPPTAADQAYDSRLRSSAAAVRGFQGPMEGAWTLSAGGRAVYALQLVDRGGYVDGAWRDLRRTGALDGSGFIDEVQRAGGDVTIRFAAGIMAVLRARDGQWTGRLTEGGRTETVTLVRRAQ